MKTFLCTAENASRGPQKCISLHWGKATKSGQPYSKIPTEDEFKQIHQTFKELVNNYEAIILLAGWCGLRRGEIFASKWDDINDKESTIRIDEAVAVKADSCHDLEFKDPKSSKGIREAIAPDYLINLLPV